MFRAIRRAWWKLRARSAFAGLKAAPEAKAALIAKYVADRGAGLDAERAAKAAERAAQKTAGPAKPSAYVHEKVQGLSTEAPVERKPGELRPERVSKSARTERQLRAQTREQWKRAMKKGGGK